MKKIVMISFLVGLVLSLSSCGKSKKVKIIDANWDEQHLMSQMFIQLAEAKTDYKVEYINCNGGVSIEIEALRKGDVDIYPSHSATQIYLAQKVAFTDKFRNPEVTKEKAVEIVEASGEYKFGKYLGYVNNYAVIVNEDWAEENNVTKVSDLLRFNGQLVGGASFDIYSRDDELNWTNFLNWYGIKLKSDSSLDWGLMYKALGSRDVDVIIGETAAGYNRKYNGRVLDDDKNFWAVYHAGWAYANDFPQELINVLDMMEGKYTEQEMTDALFKVLDGQCDVKQAATDLLKLKNLL